MSIKLLLSFSRLNFISLNFFAKSLVFYILKIHIKNFNLILSFKVHLNYKKTYYISFLNSKLIKPKIPG